jgi:RNA polymerase sigma factor (sigma-70 family)
VLEHGCEPTSRDLAACTGLPRDQVDGLVLAERRPRGLEQRVAEDAGATTVFADLVADPRAEDAYDQVTRAIEPASVPQLLDRLSDRERTVVRARFGLGAPERALRQVGSDLNVSAERVRQIQEQALEKLRAAVA